MRGEKAGAPDEAGVRSRGQDDRAGAFDRLAALVPRPSERTADLTRELALEGRHGAGLILLHSRGLRLVSGYDWRRRDRGWEPHPQSRQLVSGHKGMPWSHHGFEPHALVDQGGGRVVWVALLGTWCADPAGAGKRSGARSDWGDGTEANFPGYRLASPAVRRGHPLWEDGEALALDLAGPAGRPVERFREGRWRFHHEPGIVVFRSAAPESRLREVRLIVAQDCPHRFLVTARVAGDRGLRAILSLRPLMRTVRLPDPDFREPVDVLASQFGFGAFDEDRLVPRALAGGVGLRGRRLGLDLIVRSLQQPAEVRLTPVDPLNPNRRLVLGADRHALREGRDGAACFDLELATRPLGAGPREVAFEVRLEPAPAGSPRQGSGGGQPVDVNRETRQAIDLQEGEAPLQLVTGDRYVDGLVRWGRQVARALVWPNGVLTTGALGYGATSHVGQDIAFVLPFLMMDGHPVCRQTARTMMEVIWGGKVGAAGKGIQDHPCDRFDFAFLPFDPARAHVFKETGAAGFLRQAIVLHRYLCFVGPGGDAEPWVRRALDLVERDYLPVDPDRGLWRSGEETQAPVYALVTVPEAFTALGEMARASGREGLADRLDEERAAVIERINRPRHRGGLMLQDPLVGEDGAVLPAGLLYAGPVSPHLPISFDLLLYNAIALASGGVREPARGAILGEMVRSDSPWLVEGAGLAKAHGGSRGVWFWHNALAVRAMLRQADPDRDAWLIGRAFERLGWMGRGLAHVNGIGCPGEEVDGGDYAMALGCLPALHAVEGLAGVDPHLDRLALAPRLPPECSLMVVANLFYRGRPRTLVVHRAGDGWRDETGPVPPGAWPRESRRLAIGQVG